MSIASSSTMRAFARPMGYLVTSSRHASTSTYNPQPYTPEGDFEPLARPARPRTPVFFSGKPILAGQIEAINKMINTGREALRKDNIYPLPASLSLPTPPDARWKSREDLSPILGEVVRVGQHVRLVELLNELHRTTYLAQLGGKPNLANRLAEFMQKFSAKEIVLEQKVKKVKTVDSLGRAQGAGKRKSASAQVWIVPTQSALSVLDEKAGTALPNTDGSGLPTAEIIVNHLPLPKYFGRIQDREALLRPLRLTGLMGAYNIFALVQGGGPTGQSQAIALALANALVTMRGDVKDVLYAGTSSFPIFNLYSYTHAHTRRRPSPRPKKQRKEEDQHARCPRSGEYSCGLASWNCC